MRNGDLSLHGRVAIVTGAARGIGYATAACLARLGASVLLQDIDGGAVDERCSRLREAGRDVEVCSGDVSCADDAAMMAELALRSWGRIDILVNNAGIGGIGKTLLELKTEEWKRMIEVDLTGVFLCCRAVLPQMIKQNRGSIVNIASITGQMGVGGSTHYAAAKAGVIGFSKALAHEVARHFINVNVISPGLVDTDMSRARGIEHQRHLVIWPRIGSVEDIAWAVAYLASDRAEFITGAVLNINGGAYM
ncbi:MAG TPA: SDR family NAD(P)-dependent oxidoreductase [Anaerolineales bacterium]|nr:SDR family NAD(P)-dependent oxidoreductase [Anaerolineales bacterium]